MKSKFAVLIIHPILLTGCWEESNGIKTEKVGNTTYNPLPELYVLWIA
jgi:hypothetical protein